MAFSGNNKNNLSGEQLKDASVQLVEQLAEQQIKEQLAKAGKNADNVMSAAEKAASVAGLVMEHNNQPVSDGMISENPMEQTTPMDEPMDTNAAIIASAVPGIVHAVGIEIIIGGKVCKHFHSFQLQQSIREHHSFVLVLPHDVLGQDQKYDMEDARDFLGQNISVTFQYRNVGKNGPDRRFKGIVTNIRFSSEEGHKGHIVLSGNSPTILLDGAPHTQSFSDISLQSLVEEVIDQGADGQQLKTAIKASFKRNLLYTSQYNESHYNYLARMAAAYGEWFYYDGDVLCFGKPELPNPITLVYGRDCRQINVEMRASHVNLKHYGYNSNKDEELSADEPEVGYLGELGNYAYDQSKKIFKAPSLQNGPLRASFDGDVTTSQSGVIGSGAASLFTITGSTSIPFLHPGCLIDVNFKKEDGNGYKYFSKMLVTEVSHSLDGIGNYQNHFEAIPSNTKYLPQAVFQVPVAESQVAKVTSNSDGQGRVKVKFAWQTNGETTDFIRVMTPDAGSSDKVGTNRGLVTIPEVGDQVMVGFQHNHPDRPFVLGGMFTGKVGGGGGSGNNIKSLSSKSGHTIELNDAGGITIKDKSGVNIIVLDGTDKISVTAGDEIKLSTGSASITLKASGDITISGTKVTTEGLDFVTNSSGDAFTQVVAKGNTADISGDATTVTGTKTAVVTAPDTTVNGDAKTGIKSAGPTSIEGAIVKLN